MMHIPGYRVIRKLSQGGMSTVYLAIQISVGRVVALKVMSPHLSSDPAFGERFQREANIIGQLSHPHIIPIYDIGEHDSLNYIAMDYLSGGTVHERMAKEFTVVDALRVTREIATALDHAHEKGYIHRDIKPENILFRADGSSVLTDFGVAKAVAGGSRMTNAGQVVGTPHYMSPEQTRGKPVDGRSDLYSLGVVFYEMLTGSVPYQGDEAVAIAIKHLSAPIPILPPHCHAYQLIIDKCLAKDPDQRFQRGNDLAAMIEALETAYRTGVTATLAVTPPGAGALFKALLATFFHNLRWRMQSVFNRREEKEKDRAWFQPGDTHYAVLTDGAGEAQATVVASPSAQITQFQTTAISDKPRSNRKKVVVACLLGFTALAAGAAWFGYQPTAPANTPIPIAETSASSARHHFTASGSSSSHNGANPIQNWIAETLVVEEEPVVVVPIVTSSIETSSTSSAQSSEAPPPPTQYQLVVTTAPEDARVRILNIGPRYEAGMSLKPGPYHIEVSHSDYITHTKWVTITDSDLHSVVTLKPTMAAGEKFTTKLINGQQSPLMVNIKPGTYIQGDDNSANTSPAHPVTVQKNFAISQYEITFAEYDVFATATYRQLPDDNRWGRQSRPVINISWQDAKEYTEWLSEMSGKVYRLPTEAEWEYAARAGTTSSWWWGDDPKAAQGSANCRRGCNSSFSGLFGTKTAPVGSFAANEFGIHDTAGNVAEWVDDCYAEDYLLQLAQQPGGSCEMRVVRGGSAKSTLEQIASTFREGVNAETRSEYIGFRVVMEID